MEKQGVQQDTFIRWRTSYGRLRSLERMLVHQSRTGEDPARIAAMHEAVEAQRAATTHLFHLAQTASMSSQIPSVRNLETH